MASNSWQIDGIQVGTATVDVFVEARFDWVQGIPVKTDRLIDGTEVHRTTGLHDIRGSLVFFIDGPKPDALDEVKFLKDLFRASPLVPVQAASGEFIAENFNRVAFRATSLQHAPLESKRATIEWVVPGIIEGEWIADGDEVEVVGGGHFTLITANPALYEREDGVQTGTQPLVRLPEQTVGNPLALNATTRQFSVVPAVGLPVDEAANRDGEQRTVQDYDFTGFLIPAPSADGDVGVYEYRSSPTADWLEGTT